MENNKELRNNLILVASSIVVALVISEVGLRVLLPKQLPDEAYLTADPVMGHVLTKDPSLGHDANGFMNLNAPDQADIVAIGDSHTGGRYENGRYTTWPIFFAQLSGKTVYNMGIGGYGPVQYYRLVDEAIALKPKLVVVAFYAGNDFWDAYNMVYHYDSWESFRDPAFIDDSPMADFGQVKIKFRGIRDFVRNHSVLYKFLSQRTIVVREKLGLSKPRTIGDIDWTKNDPDSALRYENDKNIGTIFNSSSRLKGMDMTDKNIVEGGRLTGIFLSKIAAKLRQNRIRLVVAFIPTKEAAYEDVVGNKASSSVFFSSILSNEKKIKAEVFKKCFLLRIQCVDVTPSMRDGLASGQKLYPDNGDDHPLAAGYQRYASVIFDFIKRNISF